MYEKQTPRFLFGSPRLLEIRKFEDPPVHLGPPVNLAPESMLRVSITWWLPHVVTNLKNISKLILGKK